GETGARRDGCRGVRATAAPTRRSSMKANRSITVAAIALVASLGAACQGGAHPAPPRSNSAVRPGIQAPDFSLPSATGTTVSLADFRGPQARVALLLDGTWV